MGASSISAFPFFSGFVSKSMVMAEAAHAGYLVVWLMLLFASAGVFHHAGIKIPFFAFFAHDSGIRCREAPPNMLVAMGIAATLCVGIGCFPGLLYSMLPYPVEYEPYTATHVVQQWQILFFSALAFAALKLTGIYPPELRSVNLDVDWFYRRLLPASVGVVRRHGAAVMDAILTAAKGGVRMVVVLLHVLHGPQGAFARTWLTSSNVAITILLLTACLILFYL